MTPATETLAIPTPTRAHIRHLDGMLDLIGHHAALGRMLPRSRDELRQDLPGFLVVEDPSSRILATGGLRRYATGSAEIIGLAVRDDCRGLGLGRQIVDALCASAVQGGVDKLFALTLEAAFFQRLGFAPAPFSAIPEKVGRDCVRCPFRTGCREVPVLRRLGPAAFSAGDVC